MDIFVSLAFRCICFGYSSLGLVFSISDVFWRTIILGQSARKHNSLAYDYSGTVKHGRFTWYAYGKYATKKHWYYRLWSTWANYFFADRYTKHEKNQISQSRRLTTEVFTKKGMLNSLAMVS